MLNLGDINFGVDIDTSPLAASINMIQQFGKAVERASQMTGDGAASAAAQLRKQEAAALSALQTTLNFQQRVYRSAGPQSAIDDTNGAFERLARTMSSTTTTQLDMQRAQENFRATLGNSAREMRDYIDATTTGTEKQAQFFSETQSGSSRLMNMSANLERLTASSADFFSQTQAGSAKIQRMAVAMEGLVAPTTAFLSETQSGSAKIIKMSNDIDKLANSLRNAGVAENVFFSQTQTGSAKLIAMSRAITEMQNASNKGTGGKSPVITFFRDLTSAATLTYGPLSGVGARVQALGSVFSAGEARMAGFVVGVALVGAALYELTEGAIKTAIQLNVMQQRFEAIGGSAEFSSQELSRLHDMSMRLGIGFLGTADSFSRFIVAGQDGGLSMKELTKIFDTFAGVGAKLHLPADEMDRVFQALQRMMSTGVVNARELRLQLSTALPGAFHQAALAMGLTDEALTKLSRSGGLFADELLPKMADQLIKFYGVSDSTRIDSLSASIGRANNSVVDMYAAFDQLSGASIRFKQFLESTTVVVEDLAGIFIKLKSAGIDVDIFGAILNAMTAGIPAIADFGGVTITDLINKIRGVKPAADDAGAALESIGKQAIGNVADLDNYIKSIKDVNLANSTNTINELANARALKDSTEGLVVADKARLQAAREAANVPGVTGAAYVGIQQAINDATSSLVQHQTELHRIEDDIKKLQKAWEEESKAEQAALNVVTPDQQDAINAINAQLAQMKQLKGAAAQGAEAVRSVEDRWKDFNTNSGPLKKLEEDLVKSKRLTTDMLDSLNTGINKVLISGKKPSTSLIDELGITGVANANLKDFFNNIETHHELIPKAAKDMQALANVIRDTAQNYAKAEATIGGSGALAALNHQFEINDKADQAADRIRRLGLSAGQAAVLANGLKNSLQALETAELQLGEVTQIQMIVNNNRMADALGLGSDAVKELQITLAHQDELKTFTDKVAALGITGQEAANLIKEFDDSLNRLDAAKFASATKRMSELTKPVKDQLDLFKAFSASVETATKGASDAIAGMVTSGNWDMSKLGDVFKSMITSMISDAIRLRLIKPIFDDIFGNISEGGGVSGGMGGLGLLTGLFGGNGLSGGDLVGNFNKTPGNLATNSGGATDLISSLFDDFVGIFDSGGIVPPGKWGIKGGKKEIIQGGSFGVSVMPLDAMDTGGRGSESGTVVHQTIHFHTEGALLTTDMYKEMLNIGDKAAKQGAQGGYQQVSKNFDQIRAQNDLLSS